MYLFNRIQKSLELHNDQNAFCIGHVFYTYSDLAFAISGIRKYIQNEINDQEKIIGLITNDDLETYAAILALWFEGKSYVPLNPEVPEEWNINILNLADVSTILDSAIQPSLTFERILSIKNLPAASVNLVPAVTPDANLAYILFTSGTTGSPKGVPINRSNLAGIIDAFEAIGFNIGKSDKCLQMFELTFDVSVICYMFPLLRGGCVYTIPRGTIKYSYVFDLMDEQGLTFTMMVPSLLQYLRPYFSEMTLPDIKYSLLTAEALPLDLADEWSVCVPNSRIINLYGPTENSVFSTYYTLKKDNLNKSVNGILSIGKPMEGTQVIFIDEEDQLVQQGEKGQMCLSGKQLTPGYWNNEEKNKVAFFERYHNGTRTRFYKTGDLCYEDADNDIMYLGRIDLQAKIQGFRVEISEIEFHCKNYLERTNLVGITFINKIGNTEIGLAIESSSFDMTGLIGYLKIKLPIYMIPTKVIFVALLPLNTNGKIDRNKLKINFQS